MPPFFFKTSIAALTTVCMFAGPVSAKITTPERGSVERVAILDAVRASASHDLGAPIIFVVDRLEVDGNLGFMRGTAIRPSGADIDISQTPMVLRDEIPLHLISGPTVEAFVKRTDGAWIVDDYAVGAEGEWWAGPPYCAEYSAFMPAGAC